jgi:hypothetical protein
MAALNAITQYFHNNWSEINLTSCDLILMNRNVGIIHSNATMTTHFYLLKRLRLGAVKPSLPHTPLWRGVRLGIVGSNHTQGMDVCIAFILFLCCSVCR